MKLAILILGLAIDAVTVESGDVDSRQVGLLFPLGIGTEGTQKSD